MIGVLLLIVGASITLFSFAVDKRSSSPWIAPEVLANKPFMVSIVTMLLTMLVNAISNILLPFYLQSYGGLSPFYSGLLMMLQSATMLFITPIAGVLADKWDRMKLTSIGLFILTISQIGYALYPTKLNLIAIITPNHLKWCWHWIIPNP
ncbi:hypothetical protein OKN36_21870 [Furfurilactobacillus sp. OKN36]